MKNRFGVEINRGHVVTFHTARSGIRGGTVLKFTRMSIYGWFIETTGGSCALDDVITSKDTRQPVRDDVTECKYHRPPTPSEIRFGHGATHYRTFAIAECCHQGTRVAKKWFVADDGLRYYR